MHHSHGAGGRPIRRAAVVGGGPAGATAAAELARRGVSVVLYHVDSPHGEKPCGGGITHRAFDRFPYLHELSIDRNPVHRVRLLSPSGRETRLDRDEPIFYIYSRGDLDRALRDRARSMGAEIRSVSVQACAESAAGIVVSAGGSHETFDAIVGADGVFSRVRRQFSGPLSHRYVVAAVDELVENIDGSEGVTLAFYRDITGYLWVFPRKKLASIGLLAREGELRGDTMRERVKTYISEHYKNARSVRSVGWAIPAPGAEGETGIEIAGPQYALVGDAAGLADPLTGEGIYYAVLSGTVAAECLAESQPGLYRQRLAELLKNELINSGRWREKYFRARYIEAVLAAGRWSGRVRRVLIDILSGRQEYTDLDARIRSELGLMGWLLRRL
jgi:geranylgeranyl reductase family protein